MQIRPTRPVAWYGSAASLLLLLQACGGGSDSPSDATPNEPVATGVPAVAAPAGTLIQLTAATSCSIPDLREAVLQRVNAARADGAVCGTQTLPPAVALQWNDTLFSAAARHALDMAARNYFSHDTPGGISFSQRLTTEGYVWRSAGENIAAGQTSVNSVMAAWLASEGHCRNIMNPGFTEVAVACVSQSGTAFATYWAMELGSRR